nr:hypothetical protein [Xenorhabdus bovienii]
MVTLSGPCDTSEYPVIVFEPLGNSPHVRMHSEYLTDDVFGSERCDCGRELQ